MRNSPLGLGADGCPINIMFTAAYGNHNCLDNYLLEWKHSHPHTVQEFQEKLQTHVLIMIVVLWSPKIKITI